ncbi:MAG: polysaccharide biosynthesis C-terminal domain-containing protein [Clostridia bacterium]|nr:polysaccharide biosynthesis C-terminal domain-containing protein [Clostridia bacterium]
MLYGIVIKYIINVVFIPQCGEIVAPIASVIYQMVACTTSFILLYKYLKEKPHLGKLFGKTILSTILMAFSIIICKKFIPEYIGSSAVFTLLTILIAMLVYFISIFGLNTFTKEEILEFPMGQKIYTFVSKFHKKR